MTAELVPDGCGANRCSCRFPSGECVRRLITLVSVTCLAVAALSRPAVLDMVLRAQEPQQVSSSPAAAAPSRATRRASTAVPSHAAPVSTPPIITTASVKGFETTVKPFLSEFCFGCHGNKGEAKNGLNLQSFESADTLIDQRNHWEDVVGMLQRGEMPPMEEEQPEDAKRQAVADWLERELARIDRVTPPDPGRVTARRLNRDGIQQHDPRPARRRPASGRRLPAGRCRLRVRQHRRRAVAVAGADGEVPVGGRRGGARPRCSARRR